MEEIEQLLAKLKKDQEVLYDDFKEQVLKAYIAKQKKTKKESFERVKDIVEYVSGIEDIFLMEREQKYVAYRSIFDHLIKNREGYNNSINGRYSGRDHTTVINSLKNYQAFSIDVKYKRNFAIINNLYLNYKSESCDVCGSRDIIEAPSMGLNCNRCNPI